MKPKDYIAFPFLMLSMLFETIALAIGGRWTMICIMEEALDKAEEFKRLGNIETFGGLTKK